MLSIMLAVVSIFLKVVILDKSTYTSILDKNNTYKQVEEAVYNKIDAVLSAKNINYDIKESIITEQDIRNEADNALSGIIDYMKTGENNIKPINSDLYKQRTSDVLHSVMGNLIKPSNSEISLNDQVQIKKTSSFNNDKVSFNNLMITKKTSQNERDTLKLQEIMTKEEAEAKVRELLKQKGMTVDEAIKKAQEKGMTEDQALKILAGYGITIDEGTKENNSASNSSEGNQGNSENKSNSSSTQTNNNSANNYQNKASDKNGEGKNPEDKTSQKSSDKSVQSGLSIIENKLLEEAGQNIEKEVEKVNFNKIAESRGVKMIAHITSIVYKLFWVIMCLPIVFMAMLIKLHDKNMELGLKQIRNAFLCSGLILCIICFSLYGLKPYERIDINPVYFKEVALYATKYFLNVLCTYAVMVLAIGLFMFIPINYKYGKQKIKKHS